jgi:hypothetical protein
MIIDLPEEIEAALKVQAKARGVSPAGYVCDVLQRDLAPSLQTPQSATPFKTGRGMFAKYGKAPSVEEIDANRADLFRNFGEHF